MAHNTVGAELENSSDRIAQLAVQGPKAIDTLQKLTSLNLSEIPYYTFRVGDFAGVPNVIISNTGYTGAGGFELYFILRMPIASGMLYLKPELNMALNLSDWEHVIRFVWKWDSVCMAMI